MSAGPRRLVAVLALTQTVGYGVLFYAFPVLLVPIATDLRASTATVAGAVTVAILVGVVAAVPVGRWLDRHGGRALMTAGSLLGVAAVLAWSRVQTVTQLYLVLAVIGLAGAASLYEAAFGVLIAATDPDRRDRALLAVTVVAGFASSVFFPLTGWLLQQYGWRTTLALLAVLLASTAIPGHALTVPTRRAHHATAHRRTGAGVRAALREPRFWWLTLAFVVHAAAISAMAILLVTYLRHAGQPATVAATVSGLLGVLSVTGRVVTSGLARRYGMTTVTAAVFAIQAAGAAALPLVGGSLAGAIACVAAFGLGFGVATIARPAILADRYGTHRYATIAAAMAVPMALAKAGAPLGAAALGPGRFLPWAAAACLVAAILLATSTRFGSAARREDQPGEREDHPGGEIAEGGRRGDRRPEYARDGRGGEVAGGLDGGQHAERRAAHRAGGEGRDGGVLGRLDTSDAHPGGQKR
jgi:predicted MFS family arabinose efflux permease